MTKNRVIIILAAGKGTRMKSDKPKVMHEIAGRPMVKHLISTLEKGNNAKDNIIVVASADNADILTAAVAPHKVVIQTSQQGTADAVKAAAPALKGFTGDVLILYGDVPLISKETIADLFAAKEEGADIALLGFVPADPAGYGRIIVRLGEVEAIVEHKDASPDEREIRLCNSGIMCVSAPKLFAWLDKIKNTNAAGEYYLTDIIAMCKGEGGKIALIVGANDELLGVNSMEELAAAEHTLQEDLRKSFMAKGVTLKDPSTTFFSFDTKIGKGVVIEPCVYFGKNVTVADNVTIKAFSHFEGATIGESASIGPFSRLRPDADIGKSAHIGNFVEIKKSTVEQGAKVNHLTYIGDARIGEKANIGAGTITCNYDGFNKYLTDIGKGAFIGSNTALIAPVKIGDGAIVGAGSAISKDVEADALALTRAPQAQKPSWAAKFRAAKQKLKEQKEQKEQKGNK